MHFDRSAFDLCCEWGLNGLLAFRETSDAVVIVDVLSFSTAVDVALSSGAAVIPYRWGVDDLAKRFAAENGAILAGVRGSPGYSLSPASLRTIPRRTVLVLPSPNGSTLSLEAGGLPVFTACLRNASAVAKRVASRGSRIAGIPAGERWSENELRPCLEDLLGAGAVLSCLTGTLSPEAEMAVAAFGHFRRNLKAALTQCASGKELAQKGFAGDVELAAEYDVSPLAPELVNRRFVDSAETPPGS